MRAAVALLLQLGSDQNALHPAGESADALARLSWTAIAGLGRVFVLTMGILALALLRARQDRLLEDAGSRRLVLVAGVAIPTAVVIAFLIHGVSVGRMLYAKPYKDRGALTVQVRGKRWWWDVRYKSGNNIVATTANEIHIPAGQPVVFQLEATDVIHSFWAPNLTGKMDLIPGRTNELWLSASQPGVWRGQCAEYCGEQHAHMAFEVVAEPSEKFGEWLQWQAKPAIKPGDAKTRRGQEVFLTQTCNMCHSIRGTNAFGQVAPDLTHVAGRRTIAAARLPNDLASLSGWVSNAQAYKPGSHMPRITMKPEDLDAVVSYLEMLK